VVVGNSPVERYWTSELQRDFERFANRVNITWFNDLTFEEMLRRAAAMPPHSAIFYFLLSEDAAGVPYTQGRALESFREVASAPIFGMGDFEIGRGIVGGPLMQTQQLGTRAAHIAHRILKGEQPSELRSPPVLFGPANYDWRELQRWKISEALLPPDSVVHFREPTVWQEYRWQILAILGVVLVQAMMIGWLYFERHRRQIIQTQLRQRLMEVIHLNRTAVAGALSASIAHELNQPLGAIQSYAEAAILYLKSSPPNITRVSQILASILRDDRRASDIIAHLRGLLKKNDALELQDLDLNDVVQDAFRIVRSEALKRGMELDTGRANGFLPVRGDRVHLQQVILNLAMNGMDAMQGCPPGSGKMSIQTALIGKSEVEVSVADSGTGIPTDKLGAVFETFYTTKQDGTGLGLSIARTIVETYGGRIWAENRPEGGAVFRLVLPLSKAAAA
jgi:signal transduction histidine kinase